MAEGRRRRGRPVLLILASLGALAGAGACVMGLRALDYSRAELEFMGSRTVEARPPLAHVGTLSWETEPYETAPELEPLRAFVRRECPSAVEAEVVACVVRTMVARFPHGEPAVEFFDPRYDPAAALESHLAGQPGHCVTRSGLASAALLSVGIPARVVQLFPASGAGHNVFSYFDREQQRWVVIDPTYGVSLHQQSGQTVASIIHGETVVFDRVTPPAVGAEDDPETVYRSAALLDGYALYPEPWLYTRVGPRVAGFPYTGHFVVIGEPSLALGWGHRIYRGGMLGLTLLSLVLAGASIRAYRRALARPSATRSVPAAPDGRTVAARVDDASATASDRAA